MVKELVLSKIGAMKTCCRGHKSMCTKGRSDTSTSNITYIMSLVTCHLRTHLIQSGSSLVLASEIDCHAVGPHLVEHHPI
jgi:limonene-1,2-epoxide hydrolase